MGRQGSYVRTDAHRESSRRINLGKRLSDEQKEKLRHTSLRLGLRPPVMFGASNPAFGKHNVSFKGYKYCACGKRLSRRVATKCQRCAHTKPHTKLYTLLRKIIEYRQWRDDVFTRDNFTCQSCGIRGGKLHAHHIKKFSKILEENSIASLKQALECEELWSMNNGQTLCIPCHEKTDGYFTRRKEQ